MQCTVGLLPIIFILYRIVSNHAPCVFGLVIHKDNLIKRLQLCVIIPLLQLSASQAVAILLKTQLFLLRVPGYLHFQIIEVTCFILQYNIQNRSFSEKGFRQELRIQHLCLLNLQSVNFFNDPASQHGRARILTNQHILEKYIIVKGNRILPFLRFLHMSHPPFFYIHSYIRMERAKPLNLT